MEKWLKLLLIFLFFIALGFFGAKFIKYKLETTIQEQDEITGGSQENPNETKGETLKKDSNFGSFGELFQG